MAAAKQDAPVATTDVTPDVTPDAPTTDAPQTPDAPTETPAPRGPITRADARRARASEQEKKAEKAERFTLDDGAEWRECAGKAEIAVCNSVKNAAGESFLYVVFRTKGREIAIPVHAVDKLLSAGDL